MPAPLLFMSVVIDFETYCELNLRSKPAPGVWAYAEHPSCEILCMGYKIGDNPTQIWTPPDPFPDEIIFCIEEGVTFEAHNVQFERAVWKNLLQGKERARFYGMSYPLTNRGPIKMPTRWRDTMAVCAYRSLPLALEDVGAVLGLEVQKSRQGEALLRALSRPRKPTKKDPDTRLSWENAEAAGMWQGLYSYCKQDVDTEYGLSRRLGWLPTDESRVWALDQNINSRGIAVDMPAVMAARRHAAQLNDKLTQELCELVGDPEMTGKKVAKFLEWLSNHGATMPNLQKDTVEQWLSVMNRDEHPEVYRALEIRQQTSINSVAKLDAILAVANKDCRCRGLAQYHGAGTGRWAGRHVQLQNLPRPTATNQLDKKGKPYLDMDVLIEHLKRHDYDSLDMIYGDVAGALTSSLRGMLVAEKGKRLYVSDFSAIEARVTMWLAGQEDKIKAFEAYDRKEGPDIYCVAAQDLYGHEINKHDHPQERQLGKVQVLGCGYQMSGPKLKDTAAKQGVPLADETANWLVQNYREKNYRVPQLWYGLQDAAIEAVNTGRPVDFRGIVYHAVRDAAGRWLTCKLPSGRLLWYHNPTIEIEEDWNGRERAKLKYEGRDNKIGGTWGTVRTYGGMLTENVVQAISRCLLVAAMFRVEEAGYPIVLHVHDELVSEVDDDYGDMKEYDALVAGPSPAWAAGLPVASEGWTGHRYKKG